MATTALSSDDRERLRQRYAEEREKRLRPDGNEQYIEPTGRFAHLLEDPYVEPAERDPVDSEVDFCMIGGGFAGLLVAGHLANLGHEPWLIEKGGDVGGTWYWNRYPGAQCDTAAMVYLPLLEETGHVPTEKYTHGPEIREHCRRVARHFDLYERALLSTSVTGLEWDDEKRRWQIRTNRRDVVSARFVATGTGPLDRPKLPGIPGLESFDGAMFHTSRWDYSVTGGDPDGAPMEGLVGKRVGVIGTGRPPCSAYLIWPSRPVSSSCSSGPLRRSMCEPTMRSIPSGSRGWVRAGRTSGSAISPSSRTAARPRPTW